jgi:general stress protein YciG
MSTNQPLKSKRGFASMTPEKRKAIASLGGRKAHQAGTAFKFTKELARAAGRIGGQAVSQNKEHMAEIGRRGGEASAISKGYNLIRFDRA